MAKYAISPEGAQSLRTLAKELQQSISTVSGVNTRLQTFLKSIMDELGIYGIDIWEISLHVKQHLEDIGENVESLIQILNKKANEIEMLMNGGLETSASWNNHIAGSPAGQVQTIEKIAEWISTINPLYHDSGIPPWERNPYHHNCGACALNVEKCLSGGVPEQAGIINIGTDIAMEQASGKKCRYMSIQDIESILKQRGAGAHLIVGINRKNTPFGQRQAGHWFNAYYDGQSIYTIDGQIGQILDWPHDYGDISEWCAMI